jgi:S1-C subfamily serine protease
MRIGDKVGLDVVRNGKHQDIQVSIAQRQAGRGGEGGINPRLDGASFAEIPSNHPATGEIEGVLVEKVERGSPAWSGGLRPGDIIMSVNQRGVGNVDDLRRQAQGNERLLLQVLRGNVASFIVLR